MLVALLLNFIPTLQVPLPPSGLLIHLTHHDIILRCSDPCLRLEVPPPRALRLRSHVWVPGGPRGEFCRPFLKQHKAPAAAAAEAAAASGVGVGAGAGAGSGTVGGGGGGSGARTAAGGPAFVLRCDLYSSGDLTAAECFDILTEKAAGAQLLLTNMAVDEEWVR